jgi:two-component system response regulator YesN
MHSVLVVDDEPFVRVSLASLRPWDEDGFEFLREAAHGREALEVLAQCPEIDVVLVDLSMPVMNGIEFLQRLGDFCQSVGRRVPATVVLSASNDFPLVRQAFTLGARDYLLKAEVDANRMLAVVQKACEGLADDPRGSRTILQRRHRDFLKQKLLKDLLTSPPSADDPEIFPTLGIALSPPLVLVVQRIDDFESIQERFGTEGLGQFQDLVRRALSQVLARHGEGEILAVGPWLWVTWWNGSDDVRARGYADDAGAYLDQYLSVRCQTQVAPVASWTAVPEAWKALPLERRIESRIVVVAKRYMREHYADEALGLDQIAAATGVSKNHLSWEFSRETGETLSGYLTRVRIDQAKALLADPQCRVLDAGARVGYPNVEHFSRVFKKLTGVSPNKWSDFVVNPAAF